MKFKPGRRIETTAQRYPENEPHDRDTHKEPSLSMQEKVASMDEMLLDLKAQIVAIEKRCQGLSQPPFSFIV